MSYESQIWKERDKRSVVRSLAHPRALWFPGPGCGDTAPPAVPHEFSVTGLATAHVLPAYLPAFVFDYKNKYSLLIKYSNYTEVQKTKCHRNRYGIAISLITLEISPLCKTNCQKIETQRSK